MANINLVPGEQQPLSAFSGAETITTEWQVQRRGVQLTAHHSFPSQNPAPPTPPLPLCFWLKCCCYNAFPKTEFYLYGSGGGGCSFRAELSARYKVNVLFNVRSSQEGGVAYFLPPWKAIISNCPLQHIIIFPSIVCDLQALHAGTANHFILPNLRSVWPLGL